MNPSHLKNPIEEFREKKTPDGIAKGDSAAFSAIQSSVREERAAIMAA